MIEDKIRAIGDACTPLIGKTIERFETAEIILLTGTWKDGLIFQFVSTAATTHAFSIVVKIRRLVAVK